MKYCPQCGRALDEGLYCPQCGAEIYQAQTNFSTSATVNLDANPYAHHSQIRGNINTRKFDDSEIPTFAGAYYKFWARSAGGRAGRTEFWYVVLWQFLIFLPLAAYISVVVLRVEHNRQVSPDAFFILAFLLFAYFVYSMICVSRSVFLLVRRLHDVGLTGWLWLGTLVPGIGQAWALVIPLLPSQKGENRHGKEPKVKRLKNIHETAS